jgi:hypothetical protein
MIAPPVTAAPGRLFIAAFMDRNQVQALGKYIVHENM